jgi:hypothetical protein
MSAARHLESRLPEVLEELSGPRTPAYFDDILGQVARTRQRPGWTFLERWLPMTAISGRIATAPRIPMRLAVAIAVLLLTLAVSIVLLAGSDRQTVPAPFGVAANGQIVFADGAGAIRVGDLATGTSTVLVPGRGHSRPVFSPDGQWLVYLQEHQQGGLDIIVSGPDGGSPRVINRSTIGNVGHLGWSPDSLQVVAVSTASLLAFDRTAVGEPKILHQATGIGGFEYLDGFNNNLGDIFRPPNGEEILFNGHGPKGSGLYRLPLGGGDPIAVYTDRTPGARFRNLAGAQWSPDGTRIAFTIHTPETPDQGRAHVINVDGSGLRQVSNLDIPGYVIDEEHSSWSPDGTRIAFGRWINPPDGGVNVRPVVIVDLATGNEKELSNIEVNGYGGWFWSPDGASILQVPGEGSEHVGQVLVLDATTGEMMKRLGWTADPNTAPNWQRTAPKT